MPWSTLPDGSGSGTLPDGTNDPAGNGKRGGGKGGRISLEQIEQAIAALEDSETRTACEDALAALKQAQEDAQQEIEAINSRRQAVMDTVRNAEMELEQKLQEAGVLPVPQQGNLPGTPAGNGTAQDPLTGEGSGSLSGSGALMPRCCGRKTDRGTIPPKNGRS